MAVHVDNHAATIFGTVIPRRSLNRLTFVFAGEYPIAELTAYGENFTKEALLL